MKTQTRLAFFALAFWAGIRLPPALAASLQTPPVALVIANDTYTYLPPLPSCTAAARTVAAALSSGGFEVIQKNNLPSGAMQAAITRFTAHLGSPSQGSSETPSTMLIYVCGYAGSYNGRDFLLPVSAAIGQPPDLLAQGVLAESVLDALIRGQPANAALLVDAIGMPGTRFLNFETLGKSALPDGIGFVAVVESAPVGGPTPLATALAAALQESSTGVAALLADLQQTMAPNAASAVQVRLPTIQAPLPDAPQSSAPSDPVETVAAPQSTSEPAVPPQSSPQSVPELTIRIPDESQMTDFDRRRVQIMLAQFGWYDGRIDGIFGPITRGAIRRFQQAIRADPTGSLKSDERERLLAAIR